MPRPALGRGLSALIGQSELAETLVREIPIAQVRTNPYQPRRQFSEESLEELAASIREMGVLQPIIVRQEGEGDYVLVAGERPTTCGSDGGADDYPRAGAFPVGTADAGDGAGRECATRGHQSD